MAPPPLTVAKNKEMGFLLRARKKISTLKAICDNPEVLELDRLSAASNRLEEAWRTYKNSQLDILGLIADYKVGDEQVTFIEMEETYEAAIDYARISLRASSGLRRRGSHSGSEQFS